MNPLIGIEISLREILSHKFRSFLSMLGIVLGVSSLLATMAISNGIEVGTRAFMAQIGGLEFLNVVNKDISAQNFDFWNLSPGRTLMDAIAIRKSAPLISHISPEMGQNVAVTVGSKTERLAITGIWPDNFIVQNHELAAGRFIADLDVEWGTRCVVIGDRIAQKFWPDRNPDSIVGELLFLNQTPFKVVGVLARYVRLGDNKARTPSPRNTPKSTSVSARWDPFRQKNESILLPLSTLFAEFKSGQFPMDSMASVRLDRLTLRIGDLTYFKAALDQVTRALEVTHRGVDDFNIETREDWFERMEQSIRSTRLSGGLIAGISLVVGGIGIMNIMLASISERVREIGIRRAVGARARDIFSQILIESVVISMLGGILGIFAGCGLIRILIYIAPSDNTPVITLLSLVLSICFAGVVGLVSGLYPALRASRLHPIQALRYE